MATTKKRKAEEGISITEYGRRKGVSHTAVNRAIESGRLVKGFRVLANGRKEIIPSIADKEWASNTNPDHWASKYSTAGGRTAKEVDPEETKAARSSTLNQAKQAQAVFAAKLSELEYKKKAGQLVEKEKVYKTLFDFGKELRNDLLAIPDRIIDDILGAPNRMDALTLLYDELANVLEKATNWEGREIAAER